MKVKELIEALEHCEPDQEVQFMYDYGDYWHTPVSSEINNVEELHVTWSDYHNMNKVVDPDEVETERKIIVLSDGGWQS